MLQIFKVFAHISFIVMISLHQNQGHLRAQGTTSTERKSYLVLRTDLQCEWRLDGKSMGSLRLNEVKKVEIGPGEHLLEANTPFEDDRWEKIVNVGDGLSVVVSISIEANRALRVWTDPDSKLKWTRQTNGSGLSLDEAKKYCSGLAISGVSSWRLPSFEELEQINPIDTNVPIDENKDEESEIRGLTISKTAIVWLNAEAGADDRDHAFRFGTRIRFLATSFKELSLDVLCVSE